jgi:hypothetical protein
MADATSTQTTTADAADRASTTRTDAGQSTCCGGPAPTGTDACCARDADVKSSGGAGCGCGSARTSAAGSTTTGCCG